MTISKDLMTFCLDLDFRAVSIYDASGFLKLCQGTGSVKLDRLELAMECML